MLKKNKSKKQNATLEKIKTGIIKFFNDPKPIIIVLIAIICFLLIFISNRTVKDQIYVGEINTEEFQVANVHYFTNGDMNYFYASNGAMLGKQADTDVYHYQMGYYVVDDEGNYIEFATRSKEADTKAKLSEVVEELSGWSFAESATNRYFFTQDVVNNFDKLHFVIKASTKKDSDDADINLDYEVTLTKITK